MMGIIVAPHLATPTLLTGSKLAGVYINAENSTITSEYARQIATKLLEVADTVDEINSLLTEDRG
jgi:hypothetical protein